MNWIPDFPEIDERGLFQRADGYWGPQEFSVWPQVHCSPVIHHMCIPRPPTGHHSLHEILEKDRVVWRDVFESDWVESGPSPFEVFAEPVGKLRAGFCNELSRDLELTIGVCSQVESQLADDQVSLLRHVANQARLSV